MPNAVEGAELGPASHVVKHKELGLGGWVVEAPGQAPQPPWQMH